MKLNFTDFGRKCQFAPLLACASVPLGVILLVNTVPEALGRLWTMPAAYVLLSWLCLVTPGKRRLLTALGSVAALFGVGVLALPVGQSLFLLALPLLYSVLLLWGLRISGWERRQEMPFGLLVTGVICHALGQIGVNTSRATGTQMYEPASLALILTFLAFIALSMLSLNRTSIDNASMSRQRVPGSMRRRNVALTIGMLVLAVLIAAIPAVIRLVETVWNYLMIVVERIAAFLMALMPDNASQGGGGPAGGMDMSGLGEPVEPSLLVKILEKVAMVLAAVLCVILLYYAGRVLWKKLRQLLAFLWSKLERFAASSSEDYEDEITDTRDEGNRQRSNPLERLRRRGLWADEKKMSPTQRVRYRYLRLRVKHPEWQAGMTARESLPEEAARLYEQARYSGEPVSAEEAERFAAGTKNV